MPPNVNAMAIRFIILQFGVPESTGAHALNVSSERPPVTVRVEGRLCFRIRSQVGAEKGGGGSTPLDG
jgi:hypothetical protein